MSYGILINNANNNVQIDSTTSARGVIVTDTGTANNAGYVDIKKELIFAKPNSGSGNQHIGARLGAVQSNGTQYMEFRNNNGNTVFTVSGSNGELLSVDDDNSGNVFTVNDISGVPIFQVNNAITASTHFVPSQNVTYDLGSSTFRWRDLYLSGSTIDLGGTLLQRDTDGNVEFKDSQTEALKTLKIKELEIGEGANKVKLKLDDNNKVKFEDSTSGDAKSESTFYKETVSSSSKHTITHNLNEEYPIVQVYNSSKQQVIPESITSVNSNVVELEFTSNFSGVIVIKV